MIFRLIILGDSLEKEQSSKSNLYFLSQSHCTSSHPDLNLEIKFSFRFFDRRLLTRGTPRSFILSVMIVNCTHVSRDRLSTLKRF